MSITETYARQAVQYVKSKMLIGASNKGLVGAAYVGSIKISAALSNVAASAVQSTFSKVDSQVACVSAQRSVRGSRFRQGRIDYSWIKAVATGSATSGCGNCGEQAALAFEYLVQRHVRPIDYVYRTDGDHACVIIGLRSVNDASRPDMWSEDVVVCDPWRGEVVNRSTIIGRGWRIRSAFHMD